MIRIIALSDTHLENEALPAPVASLARGADIILHAGDFVSESCRAALAELGRLEAVHGNSDCPALKRLLSLSTIHMYAQASHKLNLQRHSE